MTEPIEPIQMDERKVEVAIRGAGTWQVTQREAAGLVAMLNGMTRFDETTYGMVVLTIYGRGPGSPIPPIKAIRELLGLNLKEAKEAIDAISSRPIKIGPFPEFRLAYVEQVLKENGLLYRGASIVERIGKLDDNNNNEHAPVGAKV